MLYTRLCEKIVSRHGGDTEASRREGLPLIFYMFTDMKTQSTDLMFYGHNAEEIIRDAFHVEPEGNIAKLPGVVSRSWQLCRRGSKGKMPAKPRHWQTGRGGYRICLYVNTRTDAQP